MSDFLKAVDLLLVGALMFLFIITFHWLPPTILLVSMLIGLALCLRIILAPGPKKAGAIAQEEKGNKPL